MERQLKLSKRKQTQNTINGDNDIVTCMWLHQYDDTALAQDKVEKLDTVIKYNKAMDFPITNIDTLMLTRPTFDFSKMKTLFRIWVGLVGLCTLSKPLAKKIRRFMMLR